MSTLFDALLLLIRPGREQGDAHWQAVSGELSPPGGRSPESPPRGKEPEELWMSSFSTGTPESSRSPARSASGHSRASPASLPRSVVLPGPPPAS